MTSTATPGNPSLEQAAPLSSSPSRPRAIASSADIGMVPVSRSDSEREREGNGGEPSELSLGPQDRKARAMQRRLEAALAKSLPDDSGSSLSRDLILALKPERSGAATLTLSYRWYELAPDQQDAIASALWNQRSSLKLQQLDFQDPDGKTIARPPVVGNQVVILRR